MSTVANYVAFAGVVRVGLFYVGALAGVVCAFDWAVRTRRINPFSRSARFFRGRIDPALMPLERVVVRAGGSPSSAAWWALVAFVVGSIGLISLLDFFGGVLSQVIQVSQQPGQAPMLLLSWAFAIVKIALLVRVLSSWFPISPYSKWIRWSYVLTDWMIIPLGRLIPRIGMIDISPIVAWLLLSLLQRMLGIP